MEVDLLANFFPDSKVLTVRGRNYDVDVLDSYDRDHVLKRTL